jgi:hypothetical protein
LRNFFFKKKNHKKSRCTGLPCRIDAILERKLVFNRTENAKKKEEIKRNNLWVSNRNLPSTIDANLRENWCLIEIENAKRKEEINQNNLWSL